MTHTHLNVGHWEYPDTSPELSFIPVVVYLPDDIHCIALLKRQLPARTCFHNADTAWRKRNNVESTAAAKTRAKKMTAKEISVSHAHRGKRRITSKATASERVMHHRVVQCSHCTHLAD